MLVKMVRIAAFDNLLIPNSAFPIPTSVFLSSDHPLGSSRLISRRSDLAIRCGVRPDRLRLVVFFVRMWLANDFRYTILPFPVFLKRLAAARLVLIFGINLSPLFKNRWRELSNIGSRHRHRINWCFRFVGAYSLSQIPRGLFTR